MCRNQQIKLQLTKFESGRGQGSGTWAGICRLPHDGTEQGSPKTQELRLRPSAFETRFWGQSHVSSVQKLTGIEERNPPRGLRIQWNGFIYAAERTAFHEPFVKWSLNLHSYSENSLGIRHISWRKEAQLQHNAH